MSSVPQAGPAVICSEAANLSPEGRCILPYTSERRFGILGILALADQRLLERFAAKLGRDALEHFTYLPLQSGRHGRQEHIANQSESRADSQSFELVNLGSKPIAQVRQPGFPGRLANPSRQGCLRP